MIENLWVEQFLSLVCSVPKCIRDGLVLSVRVCVGVGVRVGVGLGVSANANVRDCVVHRVKEKQHRLKIDWIKCGGTAQISIWLSKSNRMHIFFVHRPKNENNQLTERKTKKYHQNYIIASLSVRFYRVH